MIKGLDDPNIGISEILEELLKPYIRHRTIGKIEDYPCNEIILQEHIPCVLKQPEEE